MNNEAIQKHIEELLEKLTLEGGEIEYVYDNELDMGEFKLHIPNSEETLGKNGEVIRALNYLIRKIVETQSKEGEVPNFHVDINGYTRKKLDHLKTKAHIIAERAKSFKSDMELEPMSPYDRLIIHSYLSKVPYVETESKGIGKDRYVIVRYKEESL